MNIVNTELVPISIMIDKAQLEQIRNMAKKEKRSVSAQVRFLLEKSLVRMKSNNN